MSPAKQKYSEKHAGKEQKTSSRQPSASGGTAATAYNPVYGTFHMLESVTLDSGTLNHNGRFKSIGEIDSMAGSNGASSEYDSVSNNGSCSGESEDQLHVNGREKQGAARLGTPPGLGGSLDKRDKIRWKNEKKHLRQKERRAKELRDRCTGYLMSRKLEALAQQLVAMGFSTERATLALILNEGHVEQSVAWLLEGGEGQVKEDWNTGGNLKIDISEELAHIADMEIKYKYSRAEVERAIVSCEGDLDKALEWLRNYHRSDSPLRMSEQQSSDGVKNVTVDATDQPSLPAVAISRIQGMIVNKNSGGLFQGTLPKREVIPMKGKLQGGLNGPPHTSPQGSARLAQSARSPPHTSKEWQVTSTYCDRGYNHGKKKTSSGTVHTSSTLHSAPVHHTSGFRAESGFSRRNTVIVAKAGHLHCKEATVLTQAPHSPHTISLPATSINACSASTSPMFFPFNWNGTFPNGSPSPGILSINATCSDSTSKKGASPVKLSENPSKGSANLQGLYHPLLSTQLDPVAASLAPNRNGYVTSDSLVSSSRLSSSPSDPRGSLLTTSGLYTGLGSAFSGSPVDWSMGTVANCDYKNIDWSMAASSSPVDAVGLWGLSRSFTSFRLSEGAKSGVGLGKEASFQPVSGNSNLVADSNSAYDAWIGSNLKASPAALGLQDKSRGELGNPSALGHHEWTTPFAGKDIFILPHQVVPSPSL